MHHISKQVNRVLAIGALFVNSVTWGSSMDLNVTDRGGVPDNYRLVWQEEFDIDQLDSTKWSNEDHRNRSGWGPRQLQYYSTKNAQTKDGILRITARKEATERFSDSAGQQYTSARLSTQGRASWTYGFFEIRARLPCVAGVRPAIWLVANRGDWPKGGEIDIMEQGAYEPGVIRASVHTGSYNHKINTQPTNSFKDKSVCGTFHRYQLTWLPDRITIGIDDKSYFSFQNDGKGDVNTWPFNEPQYLVLNVAVLEGRTGKQVDSQNLPAAMEVDYVRVYQRR